MSLTMTRQRYPNTSMTSWMRGCCHPATPSRSSKYHDRPLPHPHRWLARAVRGSRFRKRGAGPIKFEIKTRFTGEVQFTADIKCAENELHSVRLGLAVKW